MTKRSDPFRDWLTGRTREVAAALDVSTQAVAIWRNGGGVTPRFHQRVKRLAAKDGVTLTTDMLLPARKPQ